MKTNYVVGLMFSGAFQEVLLIRKQKPQWQKGLLNGVGGKVEDGETFEQAMTREFKEETGLETKPNEWRKFLFMLGVNDDGSRFEIMFFHTAGNIGAAVSQESEQLEIVNLSEINPLRKDIIENLMWVIGAAVDCAKDGRPARLEAIYE